MSMLTHEQMRDFIATHDFRSPEDVQRALKGLFAETLQAMLDGELETHLGYPKHQAGSRVDRRRPRASNRYRVRSCKAADAADSLRPSTWDTRIPPARLPSAKQVRPQTSFSCCSSRRAAVRWLE